MLTDRLPDAYARPFSEEEFDAHIRRHLWNKATQTGGWRVGSVWVLIHRNEY